MPVSPEVYDDKFGANPLDYMEVTLLRGPQTSAAMLKGFIDGNYEWNFYTFIIY
jgi:hypothetical protein